MKDFGRTINYNLIKYIYEYLYTCRLTTTRGEKIRECSHLWIYSEDHFLGAEQLKCHVKTTPHAARGNNAQARGRRNTTTDIN
jgi:hypothetical protein